MDKTKNEVFLFSIFFSVCFLLAALLFSYEIVVAFTSYSYAQQKVMDYLHGNAELSYEFTSEEREHLNDVRMVMQNVRRMEIILLLGSIALGACLFKRSALGQGLSLSGAIGLASVGAIFVLQMVSFSPAFDVFHRLFFTPGSWVFDSGSLIIQTFPIEFFMRMAQKIFVCALGLYFVFIGLGYFLTEKDKLIKAP